MQVLRPGAAVYRGLADALRQISSVEGGLGRLWRGVLSVVVGAGPAHALYFGTYELVRRKLILAADKDHSGYYASFRLFNNHLRTSLAGVCATAASDAIMTPFDLIKQRMQVHGSPHRSIWSCARTVWAREGGLTAFYLSYPTTLLLNVPFHALHFPLYEALSDLLNPQRSYHPWTHVVAGGMAGGVAAALTTPLDVVKTCLQTRGLATTDADPLARVRGMGEACRLVWKERGMSGFGRGTLPRFLTHMPATAVCWTTYEYFKWILKAQSEC